MSGMIKLQSNEGDIIEVPHKLAKCFGTISNLLEMYDIKNGEVVVPLPNITTAILKKLLVYAEHHKDDTVLPEPVIDINNFAEPITDDISPFDVDFLKVDQQTLFDIILAANYLDCSRLLESACKTVAIIIKGKTPDLIQKIFMLKSDSKQQNQ